MISGRIAVTLGVVALMAAGQAGAQQDYPSRPITFVVPYAAGGGSDVLGRVIAAEMAKVLGQPVVVENKPGAATMIGTQYVAKAKPDGYTLLQAGASFSTNPFLYDNVSYKLSDFAPISRLITYQFALATRKELGLDTPAKFQKYAKDNPGKINIGTTGTGSATHLMVEMLRRDMDIQMVDVPFNGGAPSLLALLGGNIDAHVDGLLGVLPHYKSGAINIMGVSGTQRTPVMPHVPTFKESGFPDLVMEPWMSLLAPAGTPEPIINKLNDAVLTALKTPAVRQAIEKDGNVVAPTTPQQALSLLEEDAKRMGDLIKEAGIKITPKK